MRKRLLLLGWLATLMVLGLGVWLLWPGSAITRENAAKITEGMTLADVEAILGGPARNETTLPVSLEVDDDPTGAKRSECAQQRLRLITARDPPLPLEWQSNEVAIFVQPDRQGRVSQCYAFPMRGQVGTPVDILRRWLRI